MSDRLSLYAFEPGAPGVPAASGTGVFVSGLVNLLRSFEPALAIRTRSPVFSSTSSSAT